MLLGFFAFYHLRPTSELGYKLYPSWQTAPDHGHAFSLCTVSDQNFLPKPQLHLRRRNTILPVLRPMRCGFVYLQKAGWNDFRPCASTSLEYVFSFYHERVSISTREANFAAVGAVGMCVNCQECAAVGKLFADPWEKACLFPQECEWLFHRHERQFSIFP